MWQQEPRNVALVATERPPSPHCRKRRCIPIISRDDGSHRISASNVPHVVVVKLRPLENRTRTVLVVEVDASGDIQMTASVSPNIQLRVVFVVGPREWGTEAKRLYNSGLMTAQIMYLKDSELGRDKLCVAL